MRTFYCHKSDGLFWFRVFGLGLSVKNTDVLAKSFSERHGYSSGLVIGKYTIRILR